MTGYPITSPLLPVGIATDTYTLKTRLPSNLKPTTRECMHLVTRGQFWSRDKDGGHTIRSAITLHSNFMSLYFIEPELLPIEFLHCGNRDFRPFLLL